MNLLLRPQMITPWRGLLPFVSSTESKLRLRCQTVRGPHPDAPLAGSRRTFMKHPDQWVPWRQSARSGIRLPVGR
jgi:hypothetical protein